VRLTKGSQVLETKVVIALDRRAQWTVADRRAHFDAAMKAHALFGDMSDLVDRIDAASAAVAARAKANPADANVAQLASKVDALKKKIVATKEGGAITGEERIREHADHLYGALLSWEGKPADYLVARTETLRRELNDVRAAFDALQSQIRAENVVPARPMPRLCIHCEPVERVEIETK
jgi:hypothetical protein